jgi:sulfur-oxidizing protein SoxY
MSANASRRRFIMAAAAGALMGNARICSGVSVPGPLQPLLQKITGGDALREGRVTLEIPHLSDNGHLVPLKVSVASAMTEADHVRSIHVLSERNPRPVIAVFHLNPHCGRAEIATRIRLNGAQHILVVAAMSDGTYWGAAAEVIVTETACLDAT